LSIDVGNLFDHVMLFYAHLFVTSSTKTASWTK